MSTTQPKEAAMPTQSTTQVIGVPYAPIHTNLRGQLQLSCPDCGDVFPGPASYAHHYQQTHQLFSPLSKVLQGFMEASALAWELADAMEKVSTIQHEVLKASAETLAECARALRSAMEESGLG
jgi:uncharacterized C2H2 Zn-finger protein